MFTWAGPLQFSPLPQLVTEATFITLAGLQNVIIASTRLLLVFSLKKVGPTKASARRKTKPYIALISLRLWATVCKPWLRLADHGGVKKFSELGEKSLTPPFTPRIGVIWWHTTAPHGKKKPRSPEEKRGLSS